ncbi:hypothetical protein [Gordonia paraffinivorans]|uniref:hypothetical protein n=1 Tax=Gordonia paraffinivorans TaxID=175628 RepID=UPI003FCC6743
MTTAHVSSRGDLLERRQQILDRLDTTYEDLQDRAEHYSLVGDERQAWEALQSIAFLLGED